MPSAKFTVSLCDESTMFMERTGEVEWNDDMLEGEFVAATQAALDIPTTAALAFVRSDNDGDVKLDDLEQMEALCAVDPLPVLNVKIAAAAKPKKSAELSVYREGDFMAAPTEATMDYDPAEHVGTMALLRLTTVHAFDLAPDANISFAVMIEFEKTPISSDRQLHEILLASESKVEVYFTVEAPAVTREIKLEVVKNQEADAKTAEFTFNYSAVQPEGLKKNVLTEANNQMTGGDDDDDFGGPADVSAQNLFVVIEGEKQNVTSDRLLSEVFNAHLDNDESKDSTLRLLIEADDDHASKSQNTARTITVEATFQSALNATTAKFDITFQSDQQNMLEALKQEIRGELDLSLDSKIALIATVEGIDGQIALTGDKHLSEVLAALPNQTMSVSVEEEKENVAHSIEVVCREEDCTEEATFTFKYRFDEENALKGLRVDIEENLDLDSGDFELLYVSEEDSETAPVASDRLLREIINEHIGSGQRMKFLARPSATEAVQMEDGHTKVSKKFNLFFGEESTNFTFSWINDLTTLVVFEQEVRGELDLFEGDLRIEAHVKGEKMLVDSDSILEQIIRDPELDEVNLTIELKGTPSSGASLWLNATVVARLGDKREEASWYFRCAPSQPGALNAFIADLRNELELDDDTDGVEVKLYFDNEDDKGLVDSDQKILSLAQSEPSNETNRFTAEISLPAPMPAAASTANRLAEMNALVSEWRDAMEGDTFQPSDIEQMVRTFHLDGVPLPTEDPLVVRLSDALVANEAKPLTELSDTLELWTKHFGDEVFSSFCHHCREMLDFVVEYSPATRLKRTIGLVFRQISIGMMVSRDELAKVLRDSRTLAIEDIDECLASYSENLTQTQFSEGMHWLFRDKPQEVQDVLTTIQQGAQKSPTRARREVELLRRKRLQSEIRHAMDGVTPYHMNQFASANQNTNVEDWLNLVLAACLLLGEECASRGTAECWQWLVSQCTEEEKAYNLIARLAKCGRSYAPVSDVAKAGHILISPGSDAAGLLPASRLLSGLSVWALRVAQLTCHTQRWTWPPPLAQVSHEQAPEAQHPGSPVRIRPPEESKAVALVPKPPKYEYKHSALCRSFEPVVDEPPRRGGAEKQPAARKTLQELIAEQRAEQEGQQKEEEEEAEQQPPAASDEQKPTDEEPADEEEEPPMEDATAEEDAPEADDNGAIAENPEEEENVDDIGDGPEEQKAASKIQALHRGKQGRAKAAQVKKEKDAATKIQAIQRGRKGREAAAAKKTEQEESEKNTDEEKKDEEPETTTAEDEKPAEETTDTPEETKEEDSKPEASEDEEQKKRDEAAAKIQALQRGRQGREKAAAKKAEKEGEEEKPADEAKEDTPAEEKKEEEEKPAEVTVADPPKEVVQEEETKEDEIKPESSEQAPAPTEDNEDKKLDDAATKIQALQRGRQAREAAAAKKAEKEAENNTENPAESAPATEEKPAEVAEEKKEDEKPSEEPNKAEAEEKEPQPGDDDYEA